MCGYKMKQTNIRADEFSWKCIFTKKCGYEVYESYNGTLHWFKKSAKKMKKKLDAYGLFTVYSNMIFEIKINKRKGNNK